MYQATRANHKQLAFCFLSLSLLPTLSGWEQREHITGSYIGFHQGPVLICSEEKQQVALQLEPSLLVIYKRKATTRKHDSLSPSRFRPFCSAPLHQCEGEAELCCVSFRRGQTQRMKTATLNMHVIVRCPIGWSTMCDAFRQGGHCFSCVDINAKVHWHCHVGGRGGWWGLHTSLGWGWFVIHDGFPRMSRDLQH